MSYPSLARSAQIYPLLPIRVAQDKVRGWLDVFGKIPSVRGDVRRDGREMMRCADSFKDVNGDKDKDRRCGGR